VRSVNLATSVLGGVAFLGIVIFAQAQTAVLTRSYDNGRTGANYNERVLTPQVLADKGLRRLKSLIIDDDPRLEAQPLYVPNLKMSDGRQHNVVFVSTMAQSSVGL
jgi:hypothetical protein